MDISRFLNSILQKLTGRPEGQTRDVSRAELVKEKLVYLIESREELKRKNELMEKQLETIRTEHETEMTNFDLLDKVITQEKRIDELEQRLLELANQAQHNKPMQAIKKRGKDLFTQLMNDEEMFPFMREQDDFLQTLQENTVPEQRGPADAGYVPPVQLTPQQPLNEPSFFVTRPPAEQLLQSASAENHAFDDLADLQAMFMKF